MIGGIIIVIKQKKKTSSMDTSPIPKVVNIWRIFKDAEVRTFSNLEKHKEKYHINTLIAIEEEFSEPIFVIFSSKK